MKWLKNLFASKPAPQPAAPAPPAIPIAPQRRPQAQSVKGEDIRAYCDRLEAEANRTGRTHLRERAREIRARWKL